MKNHRRKAAHVLLTVFSVILLSTVFQSQDLQIEETEEIAGIYKHDYSDEGSGSLSHPFTDHCLFEIRIFHCLPSYNTLERAYGQLGLRNYLNANFEQVRCQAPDQLYQINQKFLV